jgi:hypothetical protein
MPPPPPSGLAPSRMGTPDNDNRGTMRETTKAGFAPEGINLCLVLCRGTFAHDGSHPVTVTQALLRS